MAPLFKASLVLAFCIPVMGMSSLYEVKSKKVVADCLIQGNYRIERSSIFAEKMGEAIQALVPEIKRMLEDPHELSIMIIKEWFNSLALVRKEIAADAGVIDSNKYGLWLPDSPSQMERFLYVANLSKTHTYNSFHLTDVIGQPDNLDDMPEMAAEWVPFHESKRHSFLYPRAFYRYHHVRDQVCHLNGQNFALTRLSPENHLGSHSRLNYIMAIHPNLKDMASLRDEAYKVIMHLFYNHAVMSEEKQMDRLALAYYIFMHAPPFYRGSPAIVESFIDAFLRASLNKHLGNKRLEPFWEVIFWPSKKFSGKDFLGCFN